MATLNVNGRIYRLDDNSDIIDKPKLTQATTFYLRTSGNDNNHGMTIGAAKKTWGSIYLLLMSLDISQQTVTIDIGDGTWTDSFLINFTYLTNPGTINLIGQGDTTIISTNKFISTNNYTANTGINIFGSPNGQFFVIVDKIQFINNYYHIAAQFGAKVKIGDVTFGATQTATNQALGVHMLANMYSQIISSGTPTSQVAWVIKGGALATFYAQNYSKITIGSVLLKYPNSVAITNNMIISLFGAIDWYAATVVITTGNNAQGTKYSIQTQGLLILTGFANTSGLPGTLTGAVDFGGINPILY